jgi:hypothetical protein
MFFSEGTPAAKRRNVTVRRLATVAKVYPFLRGQRPPLFCGVNVRWRLNQRGDLLGACNKIIGPAPAIAWATARRRRRGRGSGFATQRCWICAEAMCPRVTRDAVIALVISIVATAALVSLGVV